MNQGCSEPLCWAVPLAGRSYCWAHDPSKAVERAAAVAKSVAARRESRDRLRREVRERDAEVRAVVDAMSESHEDLVAARAIIGLHWRRVDVPVTVPVTTRPSTD